MVLIAALALPAVADAGVPMLAVTWPGMLLALVPIVLLEAWVLKLRLGLAARSSLRFSLLANLASTVVGIPITWGVLVVLEMIVMALGGGIAVSAPWQRLLSVTVYAPWLVPYESELYWMVPGATLALLPAYFLASWAIEYRVIQFLLRREASRRSEPDRSATAGRSVRRAVLAANAASYVLLAILTLVWLAMAVTRGRPAVADATALQQHRTDLPVNRSVVECSHFSLNNPGGECANVRTGSP